MYYLLQVIVQLFLNLEWALYFVTVFDVNMGKNKKKQGKMTSHFTVIVVLILFMSWAAAVWCRI